MLCFGCAGSFTSRLLVQCAAVQQGPVFNTSTVVQFISNTGIWIGTILEKVRKCYSLAIEMGFLIKTVKKTTTDLFVNIMILIGCKTFSLFFNCSQQRLSFVVWFFDLSRFGYLSNREVIRKTAYKRKHCRFCKKVLTETAGKTLNCFHHL